MIRLQCVECDKYFASVDGKMLCEDCQGKMTTANLFAVGIRGTGEHLVILNARPLCMPFTKSDALNLAAWLVVLADPVGDEFEKLMTKIRST